MHLPWCIAAPKSPCSLQLQNRNCIPSTLQPTRPPKAPHSACSVCVQGRPPTLRPSCRREASSSCLHPLKSASMTSVLVTSFSLKKRFTTPCDHHKQPCRALLLHHDLAALETPASPGNPCPQSGLPSPSAVRTNERVFEGQQPPAPAAYNSISEGLPRPSAQCTGPCPAHLQKEEGTPSHSQPLADRRTPL